MAAINDTGMDKNMSLFDGKSFPNNTLDTTDYETIDYMTYVKYTAIAYSIARQTIWFAWQYSVHNNSFSKGIFWHGQDICLCDAVLGG